jgi:hypothetical protein
MLGIMAVVLFGMSGLGTDSRTGRYKKKNGLIDMQSLPAQQLRFRLNTVVGMHPCNIGEDGDAQAVIVAPNRAVFNDGEECEMEFLFENDRLKVTATNGCDGYCGMNAVGSIDGTYIKKSDKPAW